MNGAARDLRYGRRGGRWADADRTLGADLHRHRINQVAAGRWPEHSLDTWLDLAKAADLVPEADRTVTEVRAIEVRAAHRNARSNAA